MQFRRCCILFAVFALEVDFSGAGVGISGTTAPEARNCRCDVLPAGLGAPQN